jgi:hypothetical protein
VKLLSTADVLPITCGRWAFRLVRNAGRAVPRLIYANFTAYGDKGIDRTGRGGPVAL